MKPAQAVIFDFDYTLADSSRGAVDCINFALAEMRLTEVSAEAACRTIGLSLKETFLRLAGPQPPGRSDEFLALFKKRADEVMTDLTVLYAEVPAIIQTLREKGIKLGIVSTKFRYRIEEILERENLLQHFQIIIGGEDVEAHKPHPQGLIKALEHLRCAPSSIAYVGDSVADAEVAQRASAPFIAVLSGVTPREDFSSYQVLEILDNLSELPKVVC
jgi:phosphoglycolate phosphatase